MYRQPVHCPDCSWVSKLNAKRPKQALVWHRKAQHSGKAEAVTERAPAGGSAQVPLGSGHSTVLLDPEPLPNRSEVSKAESKPTFCVTLASGEPILLSAERYEETMDRHWFFWGGALKASFKRTEVQSIEEVHEDVAEKPETTEAARAVEADAFGQPSPRPQVGTWTS